MRGIRSRMERMVQSLRDDPKINVSWAIFSDPLSSEELDRVIGTTRRVLSPAVLDFYREMGEFELEWVSAGQEGLDADGGMHIMPLEEVLGDWENVTWFPGVEEHRPLLPFDRFIPEACGAFWEQEDGRMSPTMLYHYFSDDLFDTGRSFEEYVELLLKSRGCAYWQKALCREAQNDIEVREFREIMPRLFGDYDDSLFRPRDGATGTLAPVTGPRRGA